jgi:hypothetical protein
MEARQRQCLEVFYFVRRRSRGDKQDLPPYT